MTATVQGEMGATMGSTGVVSDVMGVMEQAFLLGLGAASLTKEGVQRSLDELVERGRMSRNEGTQLVERLQERGRLERENLERMVRDQVELTMRSASIVTRDEFRALELRVERLEAARAGEPFSEVDVSEPPRW